MSRWQPNARGRLEEAALELYASHGFDATTVAEIAAHAGLTERTFFRYFADKREVLFSGQAVLIESMTGAVAGMPAGTAPLDAVGAGLHAAARVIGGRRDGARRRQAVIDANPGLQERELSKLATLGTALTEALRGRGVPELAARVTAEAGIAVFKVAFERWIRAEESELTEAVEDALEALKVLSANG